MLDQTDDDSVALDAARGDRAAFARLVTTHYERIHALAWRFTGGPPDSEDLAQDICVSLGNKIRSYRGESRFTTWLYKVVLNAARDRVRRDGARARTAAAFGELDELRRDESREQAKSADWLRSEIAQLKSELRETAVLVLDEGMSHAQAAEVLEIKETTVSWRLMKVREALSVRAKEEGLRA